MPSFLNDHTAPIDTQSSGVLRLNDHLQYEGMANIDLKINGQDPSPNNNNNIITTHHASNDSFDGSSSHSTNISDASDAAPHANGLDTRTSTMSTSILPNGVPDDDGETALHDFDHDHHHLQQLDSKMGPEPIQHPPLPNRTAPPRPNVTNGTADYFSSAAAEEPRIRTSTTSVTGPTTSSHLGMSNALANKGELPAPPNSNAAGTGQRFSSPAQLPGSTHLSASTSNLHPTSAGLKQQRNTLEVPKPGQPRGSRDGVDAAFASGRFSPTGSGPGGPRRASINLVRRNTRSMHSDFPRDEAFPDEDAMRWAEAYRQKRASKRKKKEEEDDDRVLIGNKVDEKHANWVTAYNMLTGIRVSVSRTNAKLDRPLTDADFEAKAKTTFDITGNELVPSAKYDFKFKDYAPWVFRHLRQLFRLDPADYLMSLTGKYILSELGSPGKSGSFFYFSRDYRFIIKTIHHAEHKFLRKILKEYYQHVTENPNTLLSQFYGLHRVKTPWGRKIHFVVMNNLFPPHRDIHTTFDLKGSTIGRDYREEDLEKNPRATLKDLNWLRRQRHLELGLQKKRLFMEQLQKDVKLMQKLQIMDYSLLIGVHDIRKGNDENLRARNLQVFSPGGEQTDQDPNQVLMRTPSKLENQRRAAQMRQIIKAERPVPMGKSSAGMPDVLEEGSRSDSIFYQDDGGMRATHEDDTPGDEIYYLGVIDCLTHYGVIKKIEHFWKGLSHDRTQISALPPEQYGDRFLSFMEGITVSREEADRMEKEKQRQAAESTTEDNHRVGSWNSIGGGRSSSNNLPPPPTHQPPAPPNRLSGSRSPEAEETIRRAEEVASKSERHGHTEQGVPDRTLKTTGTASTGIFPSIATATAPSLMGSNGQGPIGRDSMSNNPILETVEESGEGSTSGSRDRSIRLVSGYASDSRPVTPAKDEPGFYDNAVRSHMHNAPSRAPPTPPKTAGGLASSNGYGKRLMKPDSADSGIGVEPGLGRSGSGKAAIKGSLSRDSLEKALPPLPMADGYA